jgi:hypothetical protein
MRIVWGYFMAGTTREMLIDKGPASTPGEQMDDSAISQTT